jgi:hypothetical protein
MIENIETRFTRVASALVVPALLIGSVAFAAPPVNMKSGRFVTAREKNAVKAYRAKDGYKGDADAKALAEKLFRTKGRAELVTLKDDGANHMLHVSKDDPSAHFRIDKTTGDFSWGKGMKAYLNDGTTQGLPGKDTAADVAKRHLTELGLMPADQTQLVVRGVGGVRQADLGQDGKPTAEHDKLVTVYFGRKIDGIDVGGPGSHIIVDLGANGELVSLNRRWSELNEEKKTDADLENQADVTNHVKAKLQRDGANAKSIESSAPDFGYFDDGKGNVEPAYFYTADLIYDSTDQKGAVNQIKEKHHGAVAALKGSKADFQQLEKAKSQPTKSAPRTEDKPSQKDH